MLLMNFKFTYNLINSYNFNLYEMDGYTHKEIAKHLNIKSLRIFWKVFFDSPFTVCIKYSKNSLLICDLELITGKMSRTLILKKSKKVLTTC